MGEANEPRSDCPINAAIEVFGDRWSLLVLRDFGDRYFRELQAGSEEGSPQIFSPTDSSDSSSWDCSPVSTREPASGRYSLTEPAIQLIPVFAQLGSWGLRHRPTSRAARSRRAFACA
jgi:DNA-binding HxlR family transcriptional regulator